MNSQIFQLLVLAGIAVFLILKLARVLGTRDGFEGSANAEDIIAPAPKANRIGSLEVIDGGPDRDITDHVAEDTNAAGALAEMKRIDKDFTVTEFLQGAREAYEWILMAFENGNLEEIKDYLSDEVYAAFETVIEERESEGLTVEVEFAGIRKFSLIDAAFVPESNSALLTVHFIGELCSIVKNADGEIVEGKKGHPVRQDDYWTFQRTMGSNDPNWRLVATSS